MEDSKVEQQINKIRSERDQCIEFIQHVMDSEYGRKTGAKAEMFLKKIGAPLSGKMR